MEKIVVFLSVFTLIILMGWAMAIMEMSSKIVLEPYTGPGYGVYAPGTILEEDGTYAGKLNISGVWIIEE